MPNPLDPDVQAAIVRVRAARRAARSDAELAALERRLERAFRTTHQLAVYGTLRPGRSNAHRLEAVGGLWEPAAVRGTLHRDGTLATGGFPAFLVDDDAPWVDLDLFVSERLPAHWEALDRFEGEGYRRVLVVCRLAHGALTIANLYEARGDDQE